MERGQLVCKSQSAVFNEMSPAADRKRESFLADLFPQPPTIARFSRTWLSALRSFSLRGGGC
jgi:hypothetical protein